MAIDEGDIVGRLRHAIPKLIGDAADEIERLRKLHDELFHRMTSEAHDLPICVDCPAKGTKREGQCGIEWRPGGYDFFKAGCPRWEHWKAVRYKGITKKSASGESGSMREPPW